ncbi:MAG: Crp/Fnr family transcriptional regulator [Parvularculaceae bacterium]
MAPTQRELARLLSSTALFSGFEDALIAQLASAARLKSIKKNEVVFRRGDSADSFALVVSGKVKASNATAQGKEVVLSFVGPGALVGEIAVLDGQSRSSDVIAVEATEMLVVDRAQLFSSLQGNDSAYLHIIRSLCGKIRESALIIEANTADLLSRACAGLLRLGELHGKRLEYGLMIDMVVPQKDLGAYLNMTRANANRQISYLRDEGLITFEDGRLILLDEAGLLELSETSDE